MRSQPATKLCENQQTRKKMNKINEKKNQVIVTALGIYTDGSYLQLELAAGARSSRIRRLWVNHKRWMDTEVVR